VSAVRRLPRQANPTGTNRDRRSPWQRVLAPVLGENRRHDGSCTPGVAGAGCAIARLRAASLDQVARQVQRLARRGGSVDASGLQR
jgi:hypothetical protein